MAVIEVSLIVGIVAMLALLAIWQMRCELDAMRAELQAVRAERLAILERYLGPIGAPDSPTSQVLRPLNPVETMPEKKRMFWR